HAKSEARGFDSLVLGAERTEGVGVFRNIAEHGLLAYGVPHGSTQCLTSNITDPVAWSRTRRIFQTPGLPAVAANEPFWDRLFEWTMMPAASRTSIRATPDLTSDAWRTVALPMALIHSYRRRFVMFSMEPMR